MRTKLSIFTLTIVLLFAGLATAQNKVVVVPLLKTDPDVLPTNICAGATIFGVTGIMTCTPPPPTVTSSTGRIWMDRNLGASRVAINSTDSEAYGDLYQWGRSMDGHEKRTSCTTTTLSDTESPGHGGFIVTSGNWMNPQDITLWQGVSGTNNPCPVGFRLPTVAEWESEIVSWSSNDLAGAFASPLKLVSAGYRVASSGEFDSVGTSGYYWSSTISTPSIECLSGECSDNTYITDSSTYVFPNQRSFGMSVRCIIN